MLSEPDPHNSANGELSNNPSQLTELPGVGVHLSQATKIFQAHWYRFIGMAALPTLAIFGFIVLIGVAVGVGVLSGFSFNTLSETAFVTVGATVAIGSLAFIAFTAWLQLGLTALALHRGKITVAAALGKSKDKILAFIWIGLLIGLLVFGGLMLFVIPVLIFGVWFSLVGFVLLDSNRRGLDVLIASREYVRGHWWPVVIRMVVVWLIFALLNGVTYMFEAINAPLFGTVVSFIISLAAASFTAVFLSILYQDLLSLKPNVPVRFPFKRKLKYGLVMLWGVALPVLISVFLL